MDEHTSAEVALIEWRAVRRILPPDDALSIEADQRLADFADRLAGLAVTR